MAIEIVRSGVASREGLESQRTSQPALRLKSSRCRQHASHGNESQNEVSALRDKPACWAAELLNPQA